MDDDPTTDAAPTLPAGECTEPGQPGLGARIEEYERRGTEDFFAGDYRPHPVTATCTVYRVPAEHCLCTTASTMADPKASSMVHIVAIRAGDPPSSDEALLRICE